MASKKKKEQFQVTDFKAAKYNPRKISEGQLQALDKSIQEFGDLSCVVINRRSNTIVAGHQRLTTLKGYKTTVVTKPHTDEHGTIETGYIEVKGESKYRVPVRIVDWNNRREKLANIAANSHGGDFDNQKLGKLLAELDNKTFDIELTGFSEGTFQNLVRKAQEDEPDERYVRHLSSPIYEVQGRKPSISKMMDDTKTLELQEAIHNTKLPKDVKKYLLAAAHRHTKFRFDEAAEFYAHADKEVQGLMEDCALVIVDHKKAIEHGYLKMSEEIMDMVKHDEEA